MSHPNVLFISCTLKQSPEISNTQALWSLVASLYQQKGCQTHQLRLVDSINVFATNLDNKFAPVLEKIKQADILIVGTPIAEGQGSSICQTLLERLQRERNQLGSPWLYNKVFGMITVGDTVGGDNCIARTCLAFNRLGYTNPPDNVVAWFQPMDSEAEFIEAKGQNSVEVNRTARLLVENSVSFADLLTQTPLKTDVRAITREAQAIAKAAKVDTATFITPKSIRTEQSPNIEGIDYYHTTKRIWTVMQEGIRRGFEIKIYSLEDRIFRAERDGKGFIYKIYPGHFSFRRQYADYDAEQTKSRKLTLMAKDGLAVPVSYGLFQNSTEIPLEKLVFPMVAKPDSGSLSQNVFPNLQTVKQLKQAAAVIEANGDVIKLESHISGRDYRVLIINHQYAGCVERRPANVIGDGRHTILELFHLRNQEPGRADRHEEHTTLHQLVFDDTSRQLLQAEGYTLDTVLPMGEIFYLQKKITAATGSDYVDCTDELHPSIIQGCIDFSRRFSTLTLGFDLITSDISLPLAETGGAFNEYNFLPYVDLHENCNIGQKRRVCRLIWDYIETNAARIVTTEFNIF
ncbi:MAG: hypothetical protein F6K11_31245 [Leptolyngbya sp. SIO3F4]|nr:hypothetical protein [Leptolyngbya sp. SIO3F4]